MAPVPHLLIVEFAGWRLDVTRRQLFSPTNALVPLRAAELDLLLALAQRPQRRDHVLDLTRGSAATVQTSRLRHKLAADPKGPELIKTVCTGGYAFAAAVTAVGADP